MIFSWTSFVCSWIQREDTFYDGSKADVTNTLLGIKEATSDYGKNLKTNSSGYIPVLRVFASKTKNALQKNKTEIQSHIHSWQWSCFYSDSKCHDKYEKLLEESGLKYCDSLFGDSKGYWKTANCGTSLNSNSVVAYLWCDCVPESYSQFMAVRTNGSVSMKNLNTGFRV